MELLNIYCQINTELVITTYKKEQLNEIEERTIQKTKKFN